MTITLPVSAWLALLIGVCGFGYGLYQRGWLQGYKARQKLADLQHQVDAIYSDVH